MTDQQCERLESRVVRLETAFAAHRDATDKALQLQAREYERRLNDLNHEAERILAAQQASVSREVYDVKIQEIEKAIKPIISIVALVSLLSGLVGAVVAKWLM